MDSSVSVFDKAALLLPAEPRAAALALPEDKKIRAEEIRLRVNREPTILLPGGETAFAPGYRPDTQALRWVLEIATGASAHTWADSIRQGFVTVKGGCRIGLCGTAVVGKNGVEGIRNLSSMAIRLPREHIGCADSLFPRLTRDGFASTLLVSPPGGGKTSLLRELIRLLSDQGLRVSLADERGEVSAVWEGLAQFDVGGRTDVLTGAPKAEAVMLLLRAMNPQVIALDEITAPQDVAAIESAANCGVQLLATAHGRDLEDLRSRSLYRQLMDKNIFSTIVEIRKNGWRREFELKELLP